MVKPKLYTSAVSSGSAPFATSGGRKPASCPPAGMACQIPGQLRKNKPLGCRQIHDGDTRLTRHPARWRHSSARQISTPNAMTCFGGKLNAAKKRPTCSAARVGSGDSRSTSHRLNFRRQNSGNVSKRAVCSQSCQPPSWGKKSQPA